jgi:hypothetical protein
LLAREAAFFEAKDALLAREAAFFEANDDL